MTHHEHDDEQGTYGMGLGIRIFEHQDQVYYAEAEIGPYMDEPEALGVTLVFHRLSGLDPTSAEEEPDWPSWPLDIDDDLGRNPETPIVEQFEAILRQLSKLSEADLRGYLQRAMEAEEEE